MNSYQVGDEIRINEDTDRYAQGERSGEILRIARGLLTVRIKETGYVANLKPSKVTKVTR